MRRRYRSNCQQATNVVIIGDRASRRQAFRCWFHRLNDPASRDDADNRWMSRPFMDWEAAERPVRPRHPRGEVVGRDEAADLDAPVDPGDSTYRAARCRAGPAATTCSHPRAGTPAIAFSTLRTSRPSRNQRVALNATDKPAAPDGRPLKREGAVIVLAPRQRLWLRNDELVARR